MSQQPAAAPGDYANAVRQTLQSLNTVDDATLIGLTRLGIAEVQELKREVAEILPAGNLPAFLLQGLVQLGDRAVRPDRVATDLRLLFRATKQVGLFGAFLAAPALALRGYQKLLELAGKDVASAFPDGSWQFYTEFGLREDAARHCAETVGFPREGVGDAEGLTAWVAAALHTIFCYDDLLANEWDERMLLRTLDLLLEERAAAEAPTDPQRQSNALARLRSAYGLGRVAADWASARPYRAPAGTPPERYAQARSEQFRAFVDQALARLPAEERAELDRRFATRRAAELPAYQRQMTLLATLDPESYRDQRTPLPLDRTCVAVVLGGHTYLIDACARDAAGSLLIYARDSGGASSGHPLELIQVDDGVLRDRHGRTVEINRHGRVKIGTVALGVLRPPPLAEIKRTVQSILRHAAGLLPADPADAVDLLLARAPRERQAELRALLPPATQAELRLLRTAPIIINWDLHNGILPLNLARQTHRGIGDHAMTVVRTSRGMVFDLSHIAFDGGWGMALAEIMTNQASDLLAQIPPAADSHEQETPLELRGAPDFLAAASTALARSPAETGAENTSIDLAAITLLRQRLGRRQLSLTVNDLLLLGRAMHATGYRPGALAQRALGTIATISDGPALVQQIIGQLEEQRDINPALLIPMDASAIDPRLRLHPATFRNPLPELLVRLDRCNALVSQLRAQPGDAGVSAAFAQERSALFADLYNFGAALQALKQVTMRGESFNSAALRLLGHLPQSMQHLVDLIPQKIDILNEILKGREVFSNVGQIAPGSTLTRFASARDDGATKLLVWGVMSDARGQLVVTLRDFRPHVGPLLERGRPDLAEMLAQDYLDDYAAGVNALIRRIQRVLAFQEPG
ncbi:MAG TPA: hypothetical protein VFS21_03640 [Roseiflexaceae bacterium]|nr:hypothetical protein [Roseiflexaceae bacterium]